VKGKVETITQAQLSVTGFSAAFPEFDPN